MVSCARSRATVVLPVPGGPQKMSEPSAPARIEPRQRALGSKQMILSRHLIETRWPQPVGERTRRVVFELRGLEQIGHGY